MGQPLRFAKLGFPLTQRLLGVRRPFRQVPLHLTPPVNSGWHECMG